MTVVQPSWTDPGLSYCEFVHAVSARDGGASVVCSPRSGSNDAGEVLGTVDISAEAWSALFTGECLSDAQFVVAECITHGTGFDVKFDDAGFSYSIASSVLPAERFTSAIHSVTSACAPFFVNWDDGTYPPVP